MSERNGEGETNRLNDRIREQRKRGSPRSKRGEEKQQEEKRRKKRKREPQLLWSAWCCTSKPFAMHLPPANPLRPHPVPDALSKFPPLTLVIWECPGSGYNGLVTLYRYGRYFRLQWSHDQTAAHIKRISSRPNINMLHSHTFAHTWKSQTSWGSFCDNGAMGVRLKQSTRY